MVTVLTCGQTVNYARLVPKKTNERLDVTPVPGGQTRDDSVTVVKATPGRGPVQITVRGRRPRTAGQEVAQQWREQIAKQREQERIAGQAIEEVQPDPLERIVACNHALELARVALDAAVQDGHDGGLSWNRIAKTLGMTASQVQKRWDPVTKQKHREYQRTRYYQPAAESREE